MATKLRSDVGAVSMAARAGRVAHVVADRLPTTAAARIVGQIRIVFDHDGSCDGTRTMIEEYPGSGLPAVRVKLSRNCGHQKVLLSGPLADKSDVIDTAVGHYSQGAISFTGSGPLAPSKR